MRTGAHRNHPHYWAFLLHRLSGLLLALFLPVHFYVLGLAIEGAATLDGFLSWSATPLAKLAETALVILLAAHLTGGLRLMALEFIGTRESSKIAVAIGTGIAVCTGLIFLLNGT
ncbi:succinate dehydrogenase [Thalassospiraceae bacterium LMO-JJ14]|nr:succinate dehydrogenase [Thalassospiraceae bacterium LMO-JJ14]